jgi:hypothetical protein
MWSYIRKPWTGITAIKQDRRTLAVRRVLIPWGTSVKEKCLGKFAWIVQLLF